jgi:diguanylate cyclase (GGDEF)-like protein
VRASDVSGTPLTAPESAVLAALREPAAIVGAGGRVVQSNAAWLAEGGCRPGEDYVAACMDPVLADAARAVLDGLRERAAVEVAVCEAEADRWFEVDCTRMPGDLGVLVTRTDVSDRHRASADDTLTGLASRSLFLERLREAAARGTSLAVLFLDLDDFKLINDGWGHETGDRLLIEVAERLRHAVPPGDLVARLGGDEFTVLCEGVAGDAEALAVAGRVRDALAEPFAIAGQRRHVRVSIGCRVVAPGVDNEGAEALLRDADVAMYQAKDLGKDRTELYSAATRGRIVRRLELEQELRAAVDAGEIGVHYQPQVDLVTGRVAGVEALARWRHRRFGDVSPAEFIAVAEETGLIEPLGAWVLDRVCRQVAVWHRAGVKLTATVNVSVHQLADPGFAGTVADAVSSAGIEPGSICLELTESALMGAGEGPLDVLGALKALGVYVAIDDFGTGYSSLAALKRLPVEVVKVDRSFVDGLGTDRDDTAIVASILSLAHAMGLHVIAEGVETPLHASQLVALGCTVAQGYLWSPAVPPGEIPGIVRELAPGRRRRDARGGRVQYHGEQSFIDEMLHQIGAPKEEL